MTASTSIILSIGQKIGSHKVLVGEALMTRYEHIWKMDRPLTAMAVILPETTKDVSHILACCHDHNQPISIQGGLTNLVGGTETNDKEIVVSLEKMNLIEEVDKEGRNMTVQAGTILADIHLQAQANEMTFPLNFGAKGSAQIGGIISTNAGGLRVVKYGMTRQLILGLEAVLADGTIVSSMKKIIKDNSGYDLKQLFIGSEGTLGIVTRAVLKLVEAPRSRSSVMVAIESYSQVIQLLKHMDGGLAGRLSGFELMWNNFYTRATTAPAQVRPPLPQSFPYYVLIESLGSDYATDSLRLEELTEQAFTEGIIADAAFAESEQEMEWFWRIREDVHACVSQFQNDQHFDISIPIPLIGALLENMTKQILELPEVTGLVTFGHVADGNIHIIVGKQNTDHLLTTKINAIVYNPLESIGGSISAEHGIGLHKKAYLHLSRSDAELALMKTMKVAMDPKGILNPGRIFDL